MDAPLHTRAGRGRGGVHNLIPSRNKHWSVDSNPRSHTPSHVDGERWERGGHRGGGRGRGVTRGVPPKFSNVSWRLNNSPRQPVASPPVQQEDAHMEDEYDELQDDEEVILEPVDEIREPELDTPEEREIFYQEVCIIVLQSLWYQLTLSLSQVGQS